MHTVKPMPLTGGFVRLSNLRGSISALGGARSETQQHGGLDFPSFDIPPVSPGFMMQPQRKPAPIDLRLRMDLRDVKLYVDVIVDMLLQTLDGRAGSGGLPQNGGLAGRLAANPDAKRVLNKLLERVDRLDAGKKLSPEEIIRMLLNETHTADGAQPNLPLSLRNIAITREKSASQSRLGRRERLRQETRRLVFAQIRALGKNAEISTRQKDGGSALHVAVAHADAEDRTTGGDKGFTAKRDADQEHMREPVAPEKAPARQQKDQADAPQGFAAAKIEYLQGYSRANEKTQAELAEKLVDAKTLSRLSAEAAANLNRMLEEGKLAPAKDAKPDAKRAGIAETTMTYASIYSDKGKPAKADREYNIIVKNLYYTDKMPESDDVKSLALTVINPHSDAHLRYAEFGRGISGFSGNRFVAEGKIAAVKPVIQNRAGVSEQSGADGSTMFFAEAPAAAAAASIKAQQSAIARQAHPDHSAPDMAKLKKELAAQAGKELDEIVRKKLDTDKLADKIYRNLENRLRSERIRRGIV